MGEIEYIRAHFLDTSALVKLLIYPDIKEAGSDALYNYWETKAGFYANSLCLGEALGVIKAKLRRDKITSDGYVIVLGRLKNIVEHNTIRAVDMDFRKEFLEYFDRARVIIEKYKIDFCDAIQLVTVRDGPYSKFTNESQTLLITADKDLANAANDEKVKVWDCINEPQPPS